MPNRQDQVKFESKDKEEIKPMLDVTEGYDPTKPLLKECPLGYLSRDSLVFDRKENETDCRLFYRGDPMEYKDYKIILRCSMRERKLLELDIVPSSLDGLVVNKKVLSILQNLCPSDFQVFPVTIINSNSKSKKFINKDFSFIHVIRKIDAIDIEKSEFNLIHKDKPKQRGNLISPIKLRFKSNCMGETHIGRDIELYLDIFISQALLRLLKSNDIKGAEFLPDYLSSYDMHNRMIFKELFKD